MRLVNLTPHPVRIVDDRDEIILELPGSPDPARLDQEVLASESADCADVRLSIRTIRYRAPSPLPPPIPGVLLVVSRAYAREAPRPDLVFPDQEVRDQTGRVYACRHLARFAVPHPRGSLL